jgi:glycosyltransferase involved in cell wall biosynthesis
MRIIAFTTELDASRGGKQRSMLDICRYLSQQGHEVYLLYLEGGNLLPIYEQICVQTLQVQQFDVVKGKLAASSIGLGQSLYGTFRQLKAWLGNFSQTLIYVDDHKCSLFTWALATLCRVPTLFHIRQPVVQPFPRKYWFAVQRIRQFIAVSAQVRSSWSGAGLPESRIQVIHNGIDPAQFRPAEQRQFRRQEWGIAASTQVIAYLGRIDPQKGLETLIKAGGILYQAGEWRDGKMILAGRPVLHQNQGAGEAYLQSLRELAVRYNIGDRVEFRPFLLDPVPLYQLSDVTVLPSVYPEPFGRTIIESMACGTPVLASQIGGIPEILTGKLAQFLFPPGDEQQLASLLQSCLNWRQEQPQLGTRCRDHVVANFSVQKTVRHIESLMLKMVNAESSRL